MAVASALWAEEYSTYIKQQVEFHDLGAYDKDLTWDLNFWTNRHFLYLKLL